ncbi:MAG: class D beta-lactamase [Candidatus Hydrogenedentes bacterium]|nr:class D beta-lactamase [Candidatus Hydrogenedentota bacterium]
MKSIQVLVLVLLVSGSEARALEWIENAEVGELFRTAGVDGTFVLLDAAAQTCTGHNEARARKRFVPASTFKIPNTLIGLTVGAVQSVDEPLPYGGQPQPLKSWEKDMGLREAIRVSNVPVYQALARRIGLERMQENVSRLDYGNHEVGASVDTFWLKGPLEISAIEQTQFLGRLAQDKLSFPAIHQASVREIAKLDEGDGWVLYGKTGWANFPDSGNGWWVGWVQRDRQIYSFALNMDLRDASEAGKRVEMGKACLKALGVL